MSDIKKVDWVFFRRLALYVTTIVVCIGVTYFFLMGGVGAFILDAEGFVIHDVVDVSPSYEGEVKKIYVKPGQYVKKGTLVAIMDSMQVHKNVMDSMSGNSDQYRGSNPATGINPTAQLDYIHRYRKMQEIFNDGQLFAGEDGYVGTTVAHVGQVVHPGDPVVRIFQDDSYVIAYVSDTHLFDVEEGERVWIKARNQKVKGTVTRLLPISEPLPKQIQHPHTYERRGHTVRIDFDEKDPFPIDQHVTISECGMFSGC